MNINNIVFSILFLLNYLMDLHNYSLNIDGVFQIKETYLKYFTSRYIEYEANTFKVSIKILNYTFTFWYLLDGPFHKKNFVV